MTTTERLTHKPLHQKWSEPKPRLRWRHNQYGEWIVQREDKEACCAIYPGVAIPVVRVPEDELAGFAKGVWTCSI